MEISKKQSALGAFRVEVQVDNTSLMHVQEGQGDAQNCGIHANLGGTSQGRLLVGLVP